MAKSTFLDFSTTAGDNTDCGGIGILGTNSVSNFDNAFRTLMSILRRDLDNGTVFVTKSGAYTAVANDNNAFYEFTASATLALTAAATLGADWHMMVFANGGDVTIDADGTETINGATTLTLMRGQAATIICTGAGFYAIVYGNGVAPAFVRGLILSNNAVDAANDIDISAGAAQSVAGLYVENASATTKRLDAAWSSGNGNGGLDTGSKANSQTYHLHALRKQSDGSFDALFSLSATAPTVPAGYDVIQRLGSVCTKSDGSIWRFIQWGNHFNWADEVPSNDFVATTSLPFGVYTFTNIPLGVELLTRVRFSTLGSGSGAVDATSWPPNAADASSAFVDNIYVSNPVNSQGTMLVMISADGSAKISMGVAGSPTVALMVRGWEDFTVPRIGG